ncbi:transposase family protein, partial [Streptomyces sp. NPDC059455]|uniref:transposase family protein n=1 Tax=Streptomyces sp. NPDC059455 TaxID=3346837 RepID=UPI0036BD932B
MNEDPSPVQELLFPSDTNVVITSAETDAEAIRVEARCTASNARCPACGDWSAQIHGSYLRFPADLACAGRPCVLVLRVRRFVCATPECPRRTFVEHVPGLTRRHGRTTERLRWTMSRLGLALAGRAGARLAAHLGIVTSRNTLLRRVMDLPDPKATQPRAVGVDDFALRRNQDLELVSRGVRLMRHDVALWVLVCRSGWFLTNSG